MKLTSLKIAGFRCFDREGQTIKLDDMNCFVGPNASGKTAAMMALVRLFGENPSQRQLTSDDFHLEHGEQLKSKSERKLSIECRIDFPELASDNDLAKEAIPESFNQMVVDSPGNPPYCRLRLEGVWTNNGTSAGDVEQSIHWILTDSDDAIISDDNRKAVHASDRRRIRVVYVPASRDPEKQIAITTNNAFGRLLNGLSLTGTEDRLREGLVQLQNELGNLKGIATLNQHVQKNWKSLYQGRVAQNVKFRALDTDPGELLSLLSAHFEPDETGRTILSKDLSDGMRSLFSISLTIGLFHVEQAIKKSALDCGFKEELASGFPQLSIFAVEEPENHLSPHYLGSVVTQLSEVAEMPEAQVLLSSHSPSILGRIEPDDVRYFLGNEFMPHTLVKNITLPEVKTDESYKYVREAIRGYPELYFSRLVIFGEGPSEEIILKKIFTVSGFPLDTNFISVVPLGGRHINHFWRLVHDLEIPHITILDLDREKEGAGWARIEYVRKEKIRYYTKDDIELKYEDCNGNIQSISDDELHDFSRYSITDLDLMKNWMDYFWTKFNVLFVAPLDIDLAMLESFPDTYKSQAARGPNLPNPGVDAKAYRNAIQDRVKQVLASNPSKALDSIGSSYSMNQRLLFPWYKYLFIDGSKPVAHMLAMSSLTDQELLDRMPKALKDLVEKAKNLVEN